MAYTISGRERHRPYTAPLSNYAEYTALFGNKTFNEIYERVLDNVSALLSGTGKGRRS